MERRRRKTLLLFFFFMERGVNAVYFGKFLGPEKRIYKEFLTNKTPAHFANFFFPSFQTGSKPLFILDLRGRISTDAHIYIIEKIENNVTFFYNNQEHGVQGQGKERG